MSFFLEVQATAKQMHANKIETLNQQMLEIVKKKISSLASQAEFRLTLHFFEVGMYDEIPYNENELPITDTVLNIIEIRQFLCDQFFDMGFGICEPNHSTLVICWE